MDKLVLNIKTGAGALVLSYEIAYTTEEELANQYEEARRVWAEYYVEIVAESWVISRDYTYEQEMMMHDEQEQYRQFLMLQEC